MEPRTSGSRSGPPLVRDRWRGTDAGTRYEGPRWTSRARRERDPRLVRALLEDVLDPASRAPLRLLDVPCGTGRLRPGLEAFGPYVGVDVSPGMLHAGESSRGILCADVEHLPFSTGSFDVVVCCRLLHHLRDEEQFQRVLSELVRVSRGWVVASFWDAGTLATWRRSLWPGARPPRRFARSRARMSAALRQAGADVLAWRHSLRFVSRQAFLAARKRTDRGS